MDPHQLIHATARLCKASVQAALHHLSSADGMSRWNLGMFDTSETPDGLLTGASLFDGTRAYARADIDAAKGLVTYCIGADPAVLVPRIQAQVIEGAALGYQADRIMVCLQTWRLEDMDDARWQRLMATHETEIDLIKAQLERGTPTDTAPTQRRATPA
jgi:hypothetical protein